MKNKILAIPAEAAAIPPNPKTAATNATSRKMIVQRNMLYLLVPSSISIAAQLRDASHVGAACRVPKSTLRRILGG